MVTCIEMSGRSLIPAVDEGARAKGTDGSTTVSTLVLLDPGDTGP